MRTNSLLRRSTIALTLVVAAVVGGFIAPSPAAAASVTTPYHVTLANSPGYWSDAVSEASITTTSPVIIDGGFTKTYGWAVPNTEAKVLHTPTTTTPRLMGGDVNHFFGKPFMRAIFSFEGGMPSYSVRYVSKAEAKGCTNAPLRGTTFLSVRFWPAVNFGGRPVGEVLLVNEGGVRTMSLTCTNYTRAQFGFGLTDKLKIRTGEVTDIIPSFPGGPPEEITVYVIALDIKDPVS